MSTPAELVDIALAAAGGRPAIVIVEHDSRADLRWARSTLTTNGERSSTSATVIAFHDRASGTGTASLTVSGPTPQSIRTLVADAQAAAQAAPDARDAAPLIGTPASPAADWADPAATTGASLLAPVSSGLGDVFGRAISDGIEHFGYAEHGVTTTWLGSTTGLRLRWTQPAGRVEMTAKSHGRTRSAWQGAASEDLRAVDLGALDSALRTGLEWQGRRVDVAPGRYTALLTAGAVADLACEIWWSATARDAFEGRSVFSRAGGGARFGEMLTPRRISIESDPAAHGLASCPFVVAEQSGSHSSVFDNGAGLSRSAWIDDGRLNRLIAPRATASEFGLDVTAGPPSTCDNLLISDKDGQGSLADLIARTERALLVTCVWYNRVVDPQTLLLTGLTRDGVYLIERGEVVGAVGNFRFNESPVGMLARVSDASATARTQPREMGDYVHRVAAPALVVDGFNFSTPSDAL